MLSNRSDLFAYDAWPSRKGQGWVPGSWMGDSSYEQIDYHVDLGCGTCPKGRIGVDRHPHPNVAVVARFGGDDGATTTGLPNAPGEAAQSCEPIKGLPFGDSSIRSIISHHAFEHVGEGFIELIDECYRVLVPDGILRAITPLFPSTSAVQDPDHCRFFMAHGGNAGTWDAFCGFPNVPHWTESFSVPYTKARFQKVEELILPPEPVAKAWSPEDVRELRVALKALK